MTPTNSSNNYVGKAAAALAGAKLLPQEGDVDGATSRAYYAMFEAARATLLAAGGDGSTTLIKTHSGLISSFGRLLVLPGRIQAVHGSDFNNVQELRRSPTIVGLRSKLAWRRGLSNAPKPSWPQSRRLSRRATE